MTTTPSRTAIAVFLIALGCTRRDRAPATADSLLRSSDTVAVYNAGVEAFRTRDYAAARRFWDRASGLGNHNASSNLGYLLYYGLGGPPDSLRAGGLWNDAARHGAAEAHRHLAQAISDGDARLGTLDEAYAHAVAARELALASTDPGDADIARDAAVVLNDLTPRLSAEARTVAETTGRRWAREALR